MTHTVYLNIPLETACASASLTQLPSVMLKHRTAQSIAFAAMMTAGTVAPITDYVAGSGRVVLKETPLSEVLLLDTSVVDNAEATTARRYTVSWTEETLDSDPLRDLLGDTTEAVTVWCEFQFEDASGVRRIAFQLSIFPAFHNPEDGAPDIEDPASEAWGDDRFPRIDKAHALTAGEREQLLDNIGNQLQQIISEDATCVHVYTPAGVYKGSYDLVDRGMPDL